MVSKIYLVSVGSYSDFRIIAACSTTENAEKVSEDAKKAGCDIEILEFEIDKEADALSSGLIHFSVRFEDNFKKVRVSHCIYGDFASSSDWYKDIHAWPRYELNVGGLPKYKQVGYDFIVACLAKDEEHAKKIALERYIGWKATQGVE